MTSQQQIIERAIARASEGCEGETDECCCAENTTVALERWCDPCLISSLALEVKRLQPALRAQEEGKDPPGTLDSAHIAAVITRLMAFVQHGDADTCLGEGSGVCECGAAKAVADGAAAVHALLESSALRAATAPQQEPDVSLDYVATLIGAKSVVNSSVLYRRFIDGTPLENDIAVWMTDFAIQAVKAHGKHVANFLNELYAVMVDPCAEGSINVKDMKAALIAAAIRDRDKWAATAPQEGWQTFATAPKDGRWLWLKREPERGTTTDVSAFRWDASHDMWFAGTGWWHQVPLGFTHWRLIEDQPPPPVAAHE